MTMAEHIEIGTAALWPGNGNSEWCMLRIFRMSMDILH
jgi:hypothetical protein